MPTPDSGSAPGSRGNKRRRTGDYSMGGAGIYEDDPEDEDEDQDEVSRATPVPAEDEQGDMRFYNPNQDPEKRRQLRATMRDHSRMMEGES